MKILDSSWCVLFNRKKIRGKEDLYINYYIATSTTYNLFYGLEYQEGVWPIEELKLCNTLPMTPFSLHFGGCPQYNANFPTAPNYHHCYQHQHKGTKRVHFGKGVVYPSGTVIGFPSGLLQRHNLKLRSSNRNFLQWKPLQGVFNRPIFLPSLGLLLLPATWLNSYKSRTINPTSWLLQPNNDNWF